MLSVPATQARTLFRAVISGGAEGTLAPPEFRSSVNPSLSRRGRLCPPHYYLTLLIFRPSYGPENMLSVMLMAKSWLMVDAI